MHKAETHKAETHKAETHKAETKKPLHIHAAVFCIWCPEEDSNLHGITR